MWLLFAIHSSVHFLDLLIVWLLRICFRLKLDCLYRRVLVRRLLNWLSALFPEKVSDHFKRLVSPCNNVVGNDDGEHRDYRPAEVIVPLSLREKILRQVQGQECREDDGQSSLVEFHGCVEPGTCSERLFYPHSEAHRECEGQRDGNL